MPKRIVDGEGVWKSDKLKEISHFARAEYANLIPLADANGVFQAAPDKIWSQVYSYNRDMEPEDVEEILNELAAGGLLFRWKDESEKTWGYWVGIDKPGRLPGPSRRGFNEYTLGPIPDEEAVKEYVRRCQGTGLVYFIQGRESGRIKIGVSKNPRQRMSMHQVSSPEKLILLAVTPGGRDLESRLHREFSEQHLHGEWFDCSEKLRDFINSCVSVDSTEFDDGIPKLLGLGIGSGLGKGIGQEEEDAEIMSLRQNIMDKSRELLGVRIFPGDSNWAEIKSLARVYGAAKVEEKFQEWAKMQTSSPAYPLTAFIRVADAILAGKLFGAYPTENLSQLINDLVSVANGRVVFNINQRAAIGRLMTDHSPADIKSAFAEYYGNIDGDDYLVRNAARMFTEAAEQLLYVRKKRAEDARATAEMVARCTANEQAKAVEEARQALEADVREQDLIEDVLPEG